MEHDASNEDSPKHTVRLNFQDSATIQQVEKPIHRDLSCIVLAGNTMFVACDETSGVDRLIRSDKGFDHHRHIRLDDIVSLPNGPDGEMDIEGLAVEGGWLWVLGSQSLKRGKGQDGDSNEASLDELADIDWDENRQFLGRFPLVDKEGGLWPVVEDGSRRAAHIRFKRNGRLRRWLRKDRHLGLSLNISSKENGFDVEGIVANGERVWLGLRGPVLGRNAVVLEMEFRTTKSGHLKPRRIDGRARYRKHFVDTGGMGIRDMKWDGQDLLLITGTVMSGDGPAAILRLSSFAERSEGGFLAQDDLTQVRLLPYRGKVDHPEGLARWEGNDWIVVYDSPSPERVSDDPPWFDAEVWSLE